MKLHVNININAIADKANVIANNGNDKNNTILLNHLLNVNFFKLNKILFIIIP